MLVDEVDNVLDRRLFGVVMELVGSDLIFGKESIQIAIKLMSHIEVFLSTNCLVFEVTSHDE